MHGWKRLRTRLVATYLLLALALVGLAGLVFSKALATYAAQVQAKQRSLALEQLLPKWKAVGPVPLTPDAIRDQLQELLPGWQVDVHVEPVAQVGIPPEKLQNMLVEPLDPSRDMPPAKSPLPGLFKMLSAPADTGAATIMVGKDLAGGAPMAVAISVSPTGTTMLRTVFLQVVIILVAALLLAGLVGWWLSRWITRPLARLAGATAAVAGGDFLQTVEPVGVEELDALTTQFNAMVGRLSESFRSLAAERDLARRFAADAAHELRTPVTAMRTYQEIWSEHPERAAQMLPNIGRQVHRLERVISGLLQLASLSEGSGLALAPADLGVAVGALVPGLAALADESGHELKVSLPGAPLMARLDTRLLEQILYNLVDNACKYTPPGGHLAVAVTRAEDGGGACLSVSDDGPGIAPDTVPHLFERFHRGVDTQSIPGTGLGLAIVQEAVNRLGGTITVATAPGQGSCFRVFLPAIAG